MEKTKEIAQLIIEFQNGNLSVFDEIYNKTCQKAFSIAQSICKNKEDAQDVVQEVYMYFYQKADEIKKPESFGSWLGTVTANRAKNQLRKRNPLLFKNSETEELVINSIEDEDNGAMPETDFMNEELRNEVMEIVDSLNDEKRAVIVLYYYENMKVREIAEVLEINENTVKSRMLQAKKDMSKKVEELKKKNKSLYSIAPIWLIIFALRDSADAAGKAFADSKASAAVLENIHTSISASSASSVGTAAKTAVSAAKNSGKIAAKIAGATVIQKVVAGVIAVSIIAGSAIGINNVIKNKKELNENSNTTTSSEAEANGAEESYAEDIDIYYEGSSLINPPPKTIPVQNENPITDVTDEGRCGDNVFYRFDNQSGVLTIYGTGIMSYNMGNGIFNYETFADPRIQEVIISDGVTTIGWEAFVNCKNLKKITIGKDVEKIGFRAFSCTSIETITIPENVKTIEPEAFKYCTKLQSVILPNKIKTIMNDAFAGCINLKTVSILPESEYQEDGELQGFIFGGCYNLTKITLPENSCVIGDAFAGCTTLKEITIPNACKTIRDGAFINCKSLKNIYYNGTKEEWNSIQIEQSLDKPNKYFKIATIYYNDK